MWSGGEMGIPEKIIENAVCVNLREALTKKHPFFWALPNIWWGNPLPKLIVTLSQHYFPLKLVYININVSFGGQFHKHFIIFTQF